MVDENWDYGEGAEEGEIIDETKQGEQWETDATINDVENDVKEHAKTVDIEPEIISEDKSPENEAEPEKKGGTKFNSKLGGEFLLHLVDVAIPAGIKFGIELSDKRKKVDISKLKLEYDEKEMLRPSAEETAEMLFGNMVPWQQFLLGIGVVFSSKIPDAVTLKTEN